MGEMSEGELAAAAAASEGSSDLGDSSARSVVSTLSKPPAAGAAKVRALSLPTKGYLYLAGNWQIM
jgi:hypothetical protein